MESGQAANLNEADCPPLSLRGGRTKGDVFLLPKSDQRIPRPWESKHAMVRSHEHTREGPLKYRPEGSKATGGASYGKESVAANQGYGYADTGI